MSIKFEHTEVMNFEGAIRGMRNPLNSWDKSDSGFYYDYPDSCEPRFIIGENDLDLMKRLIRAGSDHRKLMRQIIVSVDIIAPLYWWKEFETYRAGVAPNPMDIEMNSCSTMHKIHAKEFTLEDFSHEHLIDDEPIPGVPYSPLDMLEATVYNLNQLREIYLETKDKKYWWQLIQLLPSSYNQRRTLTLNYEVLLNIYGSRRNHKLDEWRIGFMEWIKSLPYAKELITNEC